MSLQLNDRGHRTHWLWIFILNSQLNWLPGLEVSVPCTHWLRSVADMIHFQQLSFNICRVCLSQWEQQKSNRFLSYFLVFFNAIQYVILFFQSEGSLLIVDAFKNFRNLKRVGSIKIILHKNRKLRVYFWSSGNANAKNFPVVGIKYLVIGSLLTFQASWFVYSGAYQ